MNWRRIGGFLFAMVFVTAFVGACSGSKPAEAPRDSKKDSKDISDVKQQAEPLFQEQNNTVKLNFTLTVDGEVVEGSEEGQPMEVVMGSGQVMPAFEKAITGLKPGDKKSFAVSPEEGFGARTPERVQSIPRDRLPADMTPEPGMVLQAKTPEGQVQAITVVEVKDDMVVMDFNHPLAGKTLNFDVEILEVK